MQDHWKHWGPPVYTAVAAYLKLTKKRKDQPAARSTDRVSAADPRVTEELMREFMQAGGRMQ